LRRPDRSRCRGTRGAKRGGGVRRHRYRGQQRRILRDSFIFKASRENWDQVVATNLTTPFALLAAATPIMREQQKNGRAPGRIVNIVSSAGLFGNFGQAAYASAKAGLVGLTRVVAMDMSRSKVACNAIAPFAATRVTDSIQPANEAQAAYKQRALQIPAHYVARSRLT